MVPRVALALVLVLALGFITGGWAQAELSALDVSAGADSTMWVDAEYIPDHVMASTDSYVVSAEEQASLDAEARDEYMLLDDASKTMYKSTLGQSQTVVPHASTPSFGESMLQVDTAIGTGVRRRGGRFMNRLKSFAGRVSGTVKRVSERVRGFVTKVQTGIHKVKDKVSNFVGNVVNKAKAFGEKLGGKLGAKIAEIAGKVSDKYNEISSKVMNTVDNVAGTLNSKIDEYSNKATGWLDKFSGQQKGQMQNYWQNQQAQIKGFQNQQNGNMQYIADMMNKNNGLLWDGIKQLRDQAGGFREGGLLPKSYVVAQKDGKPIMVGSVQGGITPLVQYTGAPQGAGIYVSRDGTAYTSGGVILPRHDGPSGPQAYVGPNGVVYNAGQYPSKFFYGSQFPSGVGGNDVAPTNTQPGSRFRLGSLFKRGGFRNLLRHIGNKAIDAGKRQLDKWQNKLNGGQALPGGRPEMSNGQIPGQQVPGQQVPGQQVPGQQIPGQQVPGQQVPGQQIPGQIPSKGDPAGVPDFDKEYERTNGEGWTTSVDPKDGLKTAVRERVNEKESTTSDSKTTVNSSTKGILGGHYDQVVGGYATQAVDQLFDEQADDENYEKSIDSAAAVERKKIETKFHRGAMEANRYTL